MRRGETAFGFDDICQRLEGGIGAANDHLRSGVQRLMMTSAQTVLVKGDGGQTLCLRIRPHCVSFDGAKLARYRVIGMAAIECRINRPLI